jgi:hypothetical protein
MIFYVRVQYTKYTEYPMGSAYTIDAPEKTDAETKARSRYASDFGFDIKYITAKAIYTCEAVTE